MNINSCYNGIKADIFSLGVTLFLILTNRGCFARACKDDKFYYNFVNNYDNYESYLKKRYHFTDEFLDLFSSMISFEEKKDQKILIKSLRINGLKKLMI